MIRYSSAKRILPTVAAATILVISANAWAADAKSPAGRGSMELQSPVSVAGTQLQSGKYRVEWTGTGDEVEVKIYSGNKAVVSTHASLMKNGTWYDHVSYATAGDGTKWLTQISFGKQKCSLRFDDKSTGSDTQQAAK